MIVQRNRRVADALRIVLAEQPDLRVTGVVRSVDDPALGSSQADLILLDADDLDGGLADAIAGCERIAPRARTCVLSLRSGSEEMQRALGAGANAYIVKSSFDQSNLLEALRRLS